MNRGYKRNIWKIVRYGMCSIIFVMAVVTAVYEYQRWEECREIIKGLEEQISSYERVVYVAAEKLPKGTIITENTVIKQIRYSDAPSEDFISEKEFGLAVSQDVPEGACLTVSMLCSAKGNVREFYLSAAEIPEHIQTGDRIDMRIRYNNAEEYVVLADKRVLDGGSGRGIVLSLTEEEILLVSSAIADCERYSNTKLYMVEYPEYEQMEKGDVTYLANEEVQMLLGREKTERESRIALEQRLLQKKQ